MTNWRKWTCILAAALPLAAQAQIDLTTLDRGMAGPRAQVLVLGTVHLSGMPAGFDPAALDGVLLDLAPVAVSSVTEQVAAAEALLPGPVIDLAQLLAERGIRANAVAPGPVWTPLIPATMPEDKVESFGEQTPLGRAAQPAELAPVYVLLASDEASYVSGARVAVTGGKPIL